ncbi:hypothetical protein BDZ45DRAFT_698576 [Acephala macrosclerotiorum]|nr:hypothetical protein BDZ45DRAFT_698576 [Acephala macrosclerotiorum]
MIRLQEEYDKMPSSPRRLDFVQHGSLLATLSESKIPNSKHSLCDREPYGSFDTSPPYVVAEPLNQHDFPVSWDQSNHSLPGQDSSPPGSTSASLPPSSDSHQRELSWDAQFDYFLDLSGGLKGTLFDSLPPPSDNDTTQDSFFYCSQCARTFTRGSEFRKHQKYHAKIWNCPHGSCSKVFPYQKDLRRHLASVHREQQGRTYYCDYEACKYSRSGSKNGFPRADNYRRHMRNCRERVDPNPGE